MCGADETVFRFGGSCEGTMKQWRKPKGLWWLAWRQILRVFCRWWTQTAPLG